LRRGEYVLVQIEIVPACVLLDRMDFHPLPICIWCQAAADDVRLQRQRRRAQVRNKLGEQVRGGQTKLC
jgi:hypothetical protein